MKKLYKVKIKGSQPMYFKQVKTITDRYGLTYSSTSRWLRRTGKFKHESLKIKLLYFSEI